MYSFTQSNIGRFTVYQSVQRAGDTHLKKFKAGVTPQNQETINVYVAGSFCFSVGDFIQVLNAGDTTLDLQIVVFPENVVATEEVMSDVGIRYCISANDGSFTKQIVEVMEGLPYVADSKSVGFVLSGLPSVSGVSVGVGASVILEPGFTVTGSGKILVLT